jgi:hypothetical protein
VLSLTVRGVRQLLRGRVPEQLSCSVLLTLNYCQILSKTVATYRPECFGRKDYYQNKYKYSYIHKSVRDFSHYQCIPTGFEAHAGFCTRPQIWPFTNGMKIHIYTRWKDSGGSWHPHHHDKWNTHIWQPDAARLNQQIY